MQNLYLSAALTLYAICAWFTIAAMIKGVQTACNRQGFKYPMLALGLALIAIAASVWAFNSGEAMAQCGKRHSVETCRHNIR